MYCVYLYVCAILRTFGKNNLNEKTPVKNEGEEKKRKIKYQRQKENNLRKKKKETKRRSSSSSRVEEEKECTNTYYIYMEKQCQIIYTRTLDQQHHVCSSIE